MADLLFQTLNPSNGELVQTFDFHNRLQIENTLQKASKAFAAWKITSLNQRAQLIQNLALILENKKTEISKTISLEMGKPLAQAQGETDKCALLCRYYAENGEEFLHDQEVPTEFKKSFVNFQPLGVILCIMPWNFPLWQVMRFAVPVLLAGNTVLLKHAPNVPLTSFLIEKLFLEAGFAQDVFLQTRPSLQDIEMIFAHKAVQGVSFTGSGLGGKKVAAMAGTHLKKSLLELGGSDAYIIFADADIEKSAQSCVASRLVNSGQTCVAGKRFLVHKSIEKEFAAVFAELMRQKTVGDAMQNPDIGPLARMDLRDTLARQVNESLQAGASLVCGGEKDIERRELNKEGFYYAPTLISNVTDNMPIWRQETFGPVAALRSFDSEEEAVALANNSSYGLGAALFGKDEEHLTLLAKEKIEAGNVAVNTFVKSDPRLPFGGIKESGYGRELSVFGLREFVNIKSVVVV